MNVNTCKQNIILSTQESRCFLRKFKLIGIKICNLIGKHIIALSKMNRLCLRLIYFVLLF